LRQRHARVRRHFEGPQLQQSETARRALRRVKLVDAELGAVCVAGGVDQQIAQQAIDQPRWQIVAAIRTQRRELAEGDFEFIQRVVARFIDARRLTRRTDEEAGEEI